MKKETREALEAVLNPYVEDWSKLRREHVHDLFDSEKKLRAENRDLKARLKAANELWDRSLLVQGTGNDPDAVERLADALDLKNKHWRNPKHPKGDKR